MRDRLVTTTAFHVIPVLGGAIVYLLGRLFGLSSKMAVAGALLSAWYFSRWAQSLHLVYFRDERLGHKITVKGHVEFLGGLCKLFAASIFLCAGAFLGGAVLGLRLSMQLFIGAAVGVLSHLILPWAFVLSPDYHHRGRRLLTYDEAKAVAEKLLPPADPGVFWGGLTLPAHELSQAHFLAVGVTRSGKTLTIRLFMQSVIPLVGMKPEEKPLSHRGTRYRAICYDPKNEMLPILKPLASCRVVLMNPFDSRGYAWRLREDIGTDFAVAREIANCLIPKPEGEKNPFFTDAARAIVAGAMTSLGLSGGEWIPLDLNIALRTKKRMRELLARHKETKHLIDQYFEPPETFQNIVSTIANQMTVLEPMFQLWAEAEREKKTVSIKEWLEGDFILVLGNDDSRRAAIDALAQAIVGRIGSLLLRPDKPPGERNLLFLDELREAGHLPNLRRILNKGLGEGTTVIAGFTDISGLEAADAYGEKEAREMIGMFSNKAVLRLESDSTAAWASRCFGELEIYEHKVSETEPGKTTTREDLVKRDSILPSQFLEIPTTNATNGLTGYYLAPYIGAYRATLPWTFIMDRLIPAAPLEECPKFIERKYSSFIAEWSDEDFNRLGFKPSSMENGAAKEANQDTNGQKEEVSQLPEVTVLKRKAARGTASG